MSESAASGWRISQVFEGPTATSTPTTNQSNSPVRRPSSAGAEEDHPVLLSQLAKYRSLMPSPAHARRLYAAVTDAARVAAALLATRLSHGRLASPFTYERESVRRRCKSLVLASRQHPRPSKHCP